MTPEEINNALSLRVEEVCSMLLPNGEEVKGDWVVGDISGSAGKSMKIALSGKYLGGYVDFADKNTKGDLINLWQVVKCLQYGEAMDEIKDYLGIIDDYSANTTKIAQGKPAQKFTLPKYTPIDQVPSWCRFLEKRKLSIEMVKSYNIGVWDNGNSKLIFPHYYASKPIMYHTRHYEKNTSGKPKMKHGKPEKFFRMNTSPVMCLWGWNGIKDTDRVVVITEGRLDALSYIQQGIPALSVPNGGGSGGKQAWIDFDYHGLIDHFNKIYISMDADSTGQEAIDEIINRLGEHRCWIVTLPDGHKDGSDAHVAGVDLKKCLLQAKQNTPEGLHRGGEFTNDIIEYFYPTPENDKSLYLPWEKSKKFKARLGEVTLIAGENGSGKTQACGHIMLAGFEQGQVFGIASMEMSPKMLLGRLTKQATASSVPSPEYIDKVSEYLNEWLWLYKKKGIADVGQILKSFLYLNKRYGVKYFVIDSMAKCGINEDDYNRQKSLIDELEAFADDNQCHVFLVHHMRKKGDKGFDKPQGKADIKGTGAISDMIDNIIIVWRNRPKEEFLENIRTDFEDSKEEKKYKSRLAKMQRASDVILNFAKQRNGDWEGKVPLWFDRNCYQYLNRPEQTPYHFVKYSKLEN